MLKVQPSALSTQPSGTPSTYEAVQTASNTGVAFRQSPVLLHRDVTQIPGKIQMNPRLITTSQCTHQEALEIRRRYPATPAFRYVRGNGFRGPPYLAAQLR